MHQRDVAGFEEDAPFINIVLELAEQPQVADRLGSLEAGRQADISVLKGQEGDWTVHDVLGASLRVTKAVMPVLTLKRGEVFTPNGVRGRGVGNGIPDHPAPSAL
jgi:predicted amidohydrolase